MDRPDIASGEALAGIVREGRAGSNTTADHIAVLDMALASLPAQARPGAVGGPRLVVRSDSAGATHGFAAACRDRHVGFSVGFQITEAVRAAIRLVPEQAWSQATETGGGIREGAWLVEVTELVDLGSWPAGSRLIVRKERPHPGAQLSIFDDAEGMRHTAFLTDTAQGVIDGQIAGLELRHRHHARVEDRIRQAKATGLRNLPCRAAAENNAWLEVLLAAGDLVAWTKLVCFTDTPDIAPLRDRHLPLPHLAHRSPDHSRRTAGQPPPRPDLGVGQDPRRRLRATPGCVRLNRSPTAPSVTPTSEPSNAINSADP